MDPEIAGRIKMENSNDPIRKSHHLQPQPLSTSLLHYPSMVLAAAVQRRALSWIRRLDVPARGTYMSLQKTSIQLDPGSIRQLKEEFPGLSISDLVRMAIDYVLETKPILKPGKTRLVKSEGVG